MSRDSESFGEPHTLTVYYDGDELTYDLEHPPGCEQAEHHHGYTYYTCDVEHWAMEWGLFQALEFSSTPVTEPGTYRIQGWSRKTYYHGVGYEHDAGVGVMEPEAAP